MAKVAPNPEEAAAAVDVDPQSPVRAVDIVRDRAASNDAPAAALSPARASGFISPPSMLRSRRYVILAAPAMDTLAKTMVSTAPERFVYFPSKWRKFADGTDNIKLGGFDENLMMPDADLLFLASFDSNDSTLSQLHALAWIAESGFISSLTILLAFLPTATMERSLKPGRIATCNTTAKLISGLPDVHGTRKTRVMLYDVHAQP